jgi:leucyl-tRNA synthetase
LLPAKSSYLRISDISITLQATLLPSSVTESESLESAAWLLEREFDAEVRVLGAEEAPDDVAAEAEPGRPAIDIAE